MKFINDTKNIIDFFIREKTKFSRKNYFEKGEYLENLFENSLKERENELKTKYNFNFISNDITIQNYKENLYILDILDKFFEIEYRLDLKVLDIGAKNWNYVKGEYTFFNKYCNLLVLDGIEIDAHRMYSNFYSRKEVANFYKKNLPNTNYIVGDFLSHDKKYDYMVWLLPFVREYPHIKWGLPLKYFNPKRMLWHAYFSLNKNGKIFVVNQGAEEYKIQKELLNECAIPYEEIGEIESEFLCYNQKRFALVIIKKSVEDENAI